MHRSLTVGLGIGAEESLEVPNIYVILKMHKNPNKFRFVTGAKNCSLKAPTITLQEIMSHFGKHFSNYCMS